MNDSYVNWIKFGGMETRGKSKGSLKKGEGYDKEIAKRTNCMSPNGSKYKLSK
jgi:hypothetical protein